MLPLKSLQDVACRECNASTSPILPWKQKKKMLTASRFIYICQKNVGDNRFSDIPLQLKGKKAFSL